MAIPSLNTMTVLDLARCEWVDRKENVIALGPSGTGKNHVALGLGLAACPRGLPVALVTAAELLFELISQRYERGSTVITGNLPFEEWTETIGTERLTAALLDRLIHHANILEMNGETYRLSQSRARLAATNK
tara:strand:+ start:5204 stop:5602 length:399 start_codon:yes stop_codon:yes gene_type:complete